MALRDVWWMQKPKAPNHHEFQYGPAHKHWPWNRAPTGIKYGVLEEYLQKNQGSTCTIDIYGLKTHTKCCRWSYRNTLTTAEQIIDELKARTSNAYLESTETVTYIIKGAKSEAIQALGYHLSLTPHFFDFGHERLTVGGGAAEGDLFYSLQYMEKYPPGIMPAEARKSHNTMRCRFRNAVGHDGAFDDHVWHVTHIRLMFVRGKNGERSQVIFHFDPSDNSIVEGMRVLLTRDNEAPAAIKGYTGLDKLISHTIYLVNWTWQVFLNEAGAHLKILSNNCVSDDLTSAQQLQYTRELHQLSSLWPRVRRRIGSSKELAEQIASHPIFDLEHNDGRDALHAYMIKKIRVIDDQIILCNELADQTNLLISLIFNIATLQDTKAAVEESRAANRLASSIGRVTMLTFIYLPLTLASSIFGMNVRHITDGPGNSPLWAYFVLAVSLMCATFGGWFIWSQLLKREERRTSKASISEQKV